MEFEALSPVTRAARPSMRCSTAPAENVALRYAAGFGETDAAFAAADYVRTECFSVQRHTALPMETRGLLAEWDRDLAAGPVRAPPK